MPRRPGVIQVPSIRLGETEESAYLERAGAALGHARLNRHYPSARRAARYLRCMGRDVHGGLYPPLQIDVRSGLPTYGEWTRVKTDVDMAAEILASLPPEAELAERAHRGGHAIWGKQLLKHRYYNAISSAELGPLDPMEVRLRRVEPEARTAHFNVILDKLDAHGLLVRTTIDLSQRDSHWDHPMLTLDEETAEHAQAFRSLIFRFASLDAEIIFARLAATSNLDVERVAKGTIGPVFRPGVRAPEPIARWFDPEGPKLREAGIVATFSLDLAARDLARDRDNDPLDDLIADRFSEEARSEYKEARKRWDYHVFKDRKFVTSASLADAVRQLCAEHRTRNVIYPLSLASRASDPWP